MARKIATADRVDRDELLEFARTRHKGTLVTLRSDGRPQMSPVACGVDDEGRVVVSTYPERAKAGTPGATRGCRSWSTPTTGTTPTCRSTERPRSWTCRTRSSGLVEYYRCIAGEHPDWDEYREAMRAQDKSLIRITIDRWGPVATGGFPPNREP